MIHVKELLPLTGYMRGGLLAHRHEKEIPHLHRRDQHSFDEIAVSAGMRGEQIIIAPDELSKFVDAKVY